MFFDEYAFNRSSTHLSFGENIKGISMTPLPNNVVSVLIARLENER